MCVADLGMVEGPATITVASGLLSITAPGSADLVGRAVPVPVAGKRVGLAVSSSGVDVIAGLLLDRVAGDRSLPFDLEVDLGEQRVGSRLRQTRLLPERFPDLRSAVRTDVSVRLSRGRLVLNVDAAWIELPPLLPRFVNDFNRRLGGLASLAPLRFAFPSTIPVPIGDGPDDQLPVVVDDLRVTLGWDRRGPGVGLTRSIRSIRSVPIHLTHPETTASEPGDPMLRTGDPVPDFTLPDQNGTPTTLSELLANGPVVLFFYPKAMTPGCTKESCHFRDLAAEFAAVGAQRVGISGDSVDKQAQFADKHDFDYPLLSDSDRVVSNIFGVMRGLSILGNKRTTFVIGTDQKVAEVISSEFNMERHADAALDLLRSGSVA